MSTRLAIVMRTVRILGAKKCNNQLTIVYYPARNTSKVSRTVLVGWRACCDSQVYNSPACSGFLSIIWFCRTIAVFGIFA